jgi:hypothetical protein
VQAVTSNGETFLAEASGKFKVQVRIKAHEIPIGNQSEKRPDKIESNCTYSKYPCSLVDVLEISINGKLLFVPRSSFCSFSDLNFVKLQLTKKGYVLTLEGGDASEGYIGRIVFNHKRVISRAVSSALAPNYILEETIYKKQVEEFN